MFNNEPLRAFFTVQGESRVQVPFNGMQQGVWCP